MTPAARERFPSPPAAAGGEGQGEGGTTTSDVLSRKARLEKIKRKVAEAARPQARVPAVPSDPSRAKESVLGLVRDLEAELVRAREREDALKGDLDEVRRELARVAGEGRSATERLAATEHELDEKRNVLSELLGELQALEEERDAAVRRAQALSALDEERAKLLEDLGKRADEETRVRAEREAEVERLSEELRLAGADGARLRAAVGELARERDQLGADLDRARRERDELAEAKRALEAVHAALAQARARIG
jgi:chromosome segregation ATPase